ncbi:MAG TPA: MaoC family dehydratase [Sphingobium sp.]
MPVRDIAIDAYVGLVGTVVGQSDWILVDQARIDAFAQATGDEQFIHVDPERAGKTAFGGTVAHGFLTLSLLSAMAFDAVPTISGAVMGINYGFDTVRMLSPVRTGSSIRGIFTLASAVERSPGQWQSTFDVSVEIGGQIRPALAARWITLTTF